MTPTTDAALVLDHLNLASGPTTNPLGQALTIAVCAAEHWVANHTGKAYDPTNPVMLQAVLQLSAFWFEQREAASDLDVRSIPFGVRALLQSEREAVTGYVQTT